MAPVTEPELRPVAAPGEVGGRSPLTVGHPGEAVMASPVAGSAPPRSCVLGRVVGDVVGPAVHVRVPGDRTVDDR
jgi:hypothetical protein